MAKLCKGAVSSIKINLDGVVKNLDNDGILMMHTINQYGDERVFI